MGLGPRVGDGAFLTFISISYSPPHYRADILGWALSKEVLFMTHVKNTKEDFLQRWGSVTTMGFCSRRESLDSTPNTVKKSRDL